MCRSNNRLWWIIFRLWLWPHILHNSAHQTRRVCFRSCHTMLLLTKVPTLDTGPFSQMCILPNVPARRSPRFAVANPRGSHGRLDAFFVSAGDVCIFPCQQVDKTLLSCLFDLRVFTIDLLCLPARTRRHRILQSEKLSQFYLPYLNITLLVTFAKPTWHHFCLPEPLEMKLRRLGWCALSRHFTFGENNEN